MSWGTLGEPLCEHLDPCVECADDDCQDCYTAADRVMDEAIHEAVYALEDAIRADIDAQTLRSEA